jgi:hypothetical protein
MKRMVLVFAIVAAITRSATAQQEMNGSRWNKFTEDMKIGFAAGFIQGVEFANQIIVVGFGSVGSDVSTLAKAQQFYGAYLANTFDEITVRQVVDGLDSFYKDYRNPNITMDKAAWVIAHAVKGTSQAEIDTMTENLRAGRMREPKRQ